MAFRGAHGASEKNAYTQYSLSPTTQPAKTNMDETKGVLPTKKRCGVCGTQSIARRKVVSLKFIRTLKS